MGSEQKDSDEDRDSTAGDNGLFEETVGNLKQSKARCKTAFTRIRRKLLVLIQQSDVTMEQIDEASEYLNVALDEAMEAMDRLSLKYGLEKDSKSNEKLGSEIEQIEVEFTDAQNRAQHVRDELSDRMKYRKSVEGLNREQLVPVNTTIVSSLPIQSNSEMSDKTKELSTLNYMQGAACNVTGKQFGVQLHEPGVSHVKVNTQTIGQDWTKYTGTSTVPCSVGEHHPRIVDPLSPGIYSQSRLLVDNNAPNQSDPALIGQDLWKQLKRVSVPVFSGEKKLYQNWKAAFTACIDQAPATAEYKLLQLRQCLSGEALRAIEGLGHSAAAYQAAKDRLERKFGGQRRQVALYLEEIDQFRPVRPGNYKDLERYADLLDIAIVNLKEANRFEELRDGLLYMKLQGKLPTSMLTGYHRWIHENHKIESVEILREWVIQETEFQTKAVETIQGLSGKYVRKNSTRETPLTFFGKSATNLKSEVQSKGRVCRLCGGPHGIWVCGEFREMEVSKRWECAKKFKLCFRCLGEGHQGQSCFRTRVCGLESCQEVHHRLLHSPALKRSSNVSVSEYKRTTGGTDGKRQHGVRSNPGVPSNKTVGSTITEGETSVQTEDTTQQVAVKTDKITMMSNSVGNVALRTVAVYIKNGERKLRINALLDDASTKTYVNADVAAELGLHGHPQRVNVNVLNGQIETFETTPVEFILESLDGSTFNVVAFTTNRVTGTMRVVDWSRCAEQWPHLQGIAFHQLGSRPIVDLLIGLDCADLHYSFKDIRGEPGEPIARLTPLGWTCVGALSQIDSGDVTTNFIRTYFISEQVTVEEVNTVLRQFWEIDSSGITDLPFVSKEEQLLLEKSEKSIKFTEGHYQIALPWKQEMLQLPNNYRMALNRLENLERRLKKSPQTAVAYGEVIANHLKKGYIRKIDPSEGIITKWFLPHFPVVKTDRVTTKVRVVFDASARCDGISLNDAIHSGPKLHNQLFDVLLRFRRYPIAIACDISEMYLRIQLYPSDKLFHRFLWRDLELSKSPDVYEFNSLVFGVNASPFLAQYVSQFHANLFKHRYPKASETILKSTYMDDSMDSVISEAEGVKLYKELCELWSKAGMKTHKWLSNSTVVMEEIPLEDRVSKLRLDDNNLFSTKVLGVLWMASEDYFMFDSKLGSHEERFTKRTFLKNIATLFDPLGFLSPFTVRAKVLMQEIWIVGVEWDSFLPEEINSKVKAWFNELKDLERIKIPRSLQNRGIVKSICLHTFVDASENAYGAVVYVRIEYDDKSISVSLAAAKTKVSPLKAVSIPRLELMGAHLGSSLAKSVAKVLSVTQRQMMFWSDSLDVLWWIRGYGRMYKPFVSNRVGDIQSSSDPEQWRYVPTDANPADYLTRGLQISELIEQKNWWTGPKYLQCSETQWPVNKVNKPVVKEVRKKYVKEDSFVTTNATSDEQSSLWRLDPMRFSSWIRLVRVHSWVNRFISNSLEGKNHRTKGELTLNELSDSEKHIIRHVQRKVFYEEYFALQKGRKLSPHSKILNLCPKIDEDGIMRLDTRLQYAEFIPYDVRHPILLPRKHWVTKLIVKHYHEKGHHNSGTNQTLSLLSTKYWIMAAREEIIEWEKECATCKRRKAKNAEQIMAPLPANRLKLSLRSFTRTAVDFGGPFITKQGRGKPRQKRYLCLFTCLASRAVHLEMAYGLDTDSFMRAFCRMSNRRGIPEEMISDNGTNFVGANEELRKLTRQMSESSKLKENFVSKGVKWTFNPPNAPHFGGVFETMIKAAKRAILAILGNADISDEELLTAFTEAEYLLNSRPLTYQTADPEDDVPLTPNHFLYGQVGGRFAPEIDIQEGYDVKKRWRRIQELTRHFWHRWMTEWVPSLSTRKKWYKERKNLQVDDVVLIVSPESQRAHWPLGRVIETYSGKDGRVRSVKLQVGNKQLIRPIVKLCPLELDSST